MRPLGIPAIEDKIVQKGMTRILEAVYEADFLDCSYGFRPNRSPHQALKQLDKIIMTQPINHIIDADIKGFFDHVDHGWMRKFLEHRISDTSFDRLIYRFLRNGYMEEGKEYDVEKGTPQGGIISPVLANIYLHYVLDLWLEKVIKSESRGTVEMVRYADDFVICVQYKDDAEKILEKLKDRLGKFGLELAEAKTRRIEFGRFSKQNAQAKGAKLAGHFRYYGISGNFRSMAKCRWEGLRLVSKWLNRRSQKKSFNWETFRRYMEKYPLPKPAIYHTFYDLKAV
jgi:group II intron reverse transcriptase/maturase